MTRPGRGRRPAQGRSSGIVRPVRMLARMLVLMGWLAVPLLPLFALTGFGSVLGLAHALFRAWSA